MYVARLDGPCGEADLAALLASCGLAEARKIRGHYVKAIPQNRNQVAEHVRRSREAM